MRNLLLNVSNMSNLTILSRRGWLIAPVLLFLAASDLPAQSHTSWEMNYGDGLKDLVTTQPLGEAAYSEADIPAEDDSEWEPATDPDVIGFNEKSKVGGNCGRKVDYTYFQTLVTVPENVEVEEFNIAFSGVDDGSRVTIFNSEHPDGEVDPDSYITLRTIGTKDLKDYLVHGENRVVITLVDNCSWNTLKSAEVTLTGAISEADVCARAVQGKVAWNQSGSKTWNPVNVEKLCRGTTDANATIECFESQIAAGTGWRQAIKNCT